MIYLTIFIVAMEGKIKEVFIMNSSDCKFNENGEVIFKRKYGKFKRPVYRFKLNDFKSLK